MLVGSRETSHTNRLDRISAKHLQLCTCLHRTDGGRRRAASRRPGLQTKMFVKGCQVASCSKLTSGYLWLVERKTPVHPAVCATLLLRFATGQMVARHSLGAQIKPGLGPRVLTPINQKPTVCASSLKRIAVAHSYSLFVITD